MGSWVPSTGPAAQDLKPELPQHQLTAQDATSAPFPGAAAQYHSDVICKHRGTGQQRFNTFYCWLLLNAALIPKT